MHFRLAKMLTSGLNLLQRKLFHVFREKNRRTILVVESPRTEKSYLNEGRRFPALGPLVGRYHKSFPSSDVTEE